MSKNVNEQNPSIYDKGVIKQSQLPPALRKPASPKPPPPEGRQPIPPLKALGLKPISSPPAPPKTTPPTSKPNPRIANLEGRVALFEGAFTFDGGQPFTVVTPLTGRGAEDKASLVSLARKQYPKSALRLVSTRIFTKEIGTPESFPAGTTLGQVFGEPGSPTENAVEVAEVFYQGEKCQVFLVNLRSRNSVTFNLRPPSGKISFSNRIAFNTPAHTLAVVLREILGKDARELKVTLSIAK